MARSAFQSPSPVKKWGTAEKKDTHVNLVVQRPNVDVLPVRAPAHTRHRTPHLPHRHALLAPIPISLPNLDRPVVRARHDEFHPRPARHRPVEGIDNPTVRADLFDALTSGDVREAEDVVCRDSVDRGRAERPVEVEDGGFVEAGQEGVVGVWRIGPPERCSTKKRAPK